MHIDKVCIIIYYSSSTRSGRFCTDNQGVTQEYKQLYILNARILNVVKPSFCFTECCTMQNITVGTNERFIYNSR